MIILRKVRGISGLTPLVRHATRSFGAGASPSAVFAALAGGPLLLLACLALVVTALLAFALGGHAGAHHLALHSVGVAPVVGSLASQLKEQESKIAAKQQTLHEVFEKAGDTVDFAKKEVLDLVGAKDSTEVVGKVREMNKELEDLGKKRDELAEMKAIQERAARFRVEPVDAPPFPGGSGDRKEAERPKSLGELIVGSKAWQEYRKGGSRNAQVSEEKGFGVPELKTVMTTGAGWSPQSLRTGLVVDKATRPIQVLDIIPTGTTEMASVVYMEETTFTNAAAERSENAAYAESAFALTERSEPTRSIGHSLPVTDEQLEDVAQAQSYLDQRMTFGVRQRLDGQILTGDGNAPNLTGILNKAGIQTQAKGADPVPDAIYKAMTLVRVTGRAFPSASILHPNDWQDIRLLRTADGIYIWGSPSAPDPDRIWGIQVVQSDALTENTGIVGDFVNFCQLFERRGLEVVVGYVNDDLTKGRKTIRAGMRVAFAIYRAAAFCTVTGI